MSAPRPCVDVRLQPARLQPRHKRVDGSLCELDIATFE